MKTKVEQRRYGTDYPGKYPYEWGVRVMTDFVRCTSEEHANEVAKLFEPLPDFAAYALSITSLKI